MVLLQSVQASSLACARGGRRVFENVSFALEKGGLLTLEGPNGAGKTSLLRMLAGFLPPLAGALFFRAGGTDVEDAEERGRFVGWLGHQDGIKGQMSVSENARFFAELHGGADETAALSRVGLARVADLPAQYLSAGQRRRLALARLLLARRPLWLLDEPLAALDAGGKALAAELIGEHCASGGMVIAATHDRLGVPGAALVLGQT